MPRVLDSPLLRFGLRFLIFFVVLALPWPGLPGAARALVCLLGNGVGRALAVVGPGRVELGLPAAGARFAQGSAEQWDVLMRLHRPPDAPFTYAISTRRSAVLPASMVAALVAASPWWRPRRRALLALAGSLATVVVLLLFSLLQLLADGTLATAGATGLSGAGGVLHAMVKALNSPTVNSVVPICCWLGLAVFASGGAALAFARTGALGRPAAAPRARRGGRRR